MTRLLVPRQSELANPRGQLIRAYDFGAAAGRDITGRGAVLANLADGLLITPRVGKAGRGAHFTLGGKYSSNELLPNISTEITVMLWAEKLGQMAGTSDFVFGEHETGAGGYNWGFYESSSSGALSFFVHNGTSGVSAGTLAWTTTAGPQVWIATYSANAGAVNLYCNGAFIATAAQSGSIRRLSTALVRSCRWQSGAPNFIGYGAAVWNYALHPDEIARVSKRPASVFSGRKRRIWVPVSAGGGSDIDIAGVVGNAVASGVTGAPAVSIDIAGSVASAVAAGITGSAQVATEIAGAVGNAVAAGVAGSASVTNDINIDGVVGNAVAAGVAGDTSVGSDISISGTVGNAVAAGTAGVPGVPTTIAATVGNATAAGVSGLAAIGVLIDGSVGNAAAAGITGTLTLDIVVAGVVANAVAAGVTGSASVDAAAVSATPGYTITAKRRRLEIRK